MKAAAGLQGGGEWGAQEAHESQKAGVTMERKTVPEGASPRLLGHRLVQQHDYPGSPWAHIGWRLGVRKHNQFEGRKTMYNFTNDVKY